MKFERLRLLGFKSFCESTELLIEPGLTGVVGPNGCGKSNLIEALRWVMGENSYKNMRASAMDDVIFSGGGSRPARNFAEVSLVLDNGSRTAPAAFNDADTIEVTRRIEREQGSDYRINGKDVRARDVQLLFADAATGARSPSLVRQGQIGEIISAKPQARRRILEDAAGVAGLHSRRHEAELRLNAASENLTRLEDVLKQVEGQSESLRRQARQATRYRGLAGQIRHNEALLALISHQIAADQLTEAAQKHEDDLRDLQAQTLAQAETAKFQAIAAHELPPLREAEAEAGAAVHRLVAAREALEADEQRARTRITELSRHIEQFARDLERERALIDDAAEVAARLEAERADLLGDADSDLERETEARTRLEEIEAGLAAVEAQLENAQEQLAGVNARRSAIESALRDESQRIARFEAELTRLDAEFALIAAQGDGEVDLARLAESFAHATEALATAEEIALAAEAAQADARAAESAARTPLEQAKLRAQRLETEVRTLENLLQSGAGGLWAPIVESVSVAKGYETALGAALGDDLDASADDSAPAHWALIDSAGDPPLPQGVRTLAELVEAPPAMRRRLAQIGVVLRSEGAGLRKLLKPGQRLVSKEGDLWRWDGFTQAAEAPTAAARRLVEKNRLADLRAEMLVAQAQSEGLAEALESARDAAQGAAVADAQARDAQRQARVRLDEARERHVAAERRQAQISQRLSGLEAGKSQALANRDEAIRKRSALEESLNGLEEPATLAGALESLRARAMIERAQASEARAALGALRHEAAARAARVSAIAREIASWAERRDRAQDRLGELEDRLEAARTEQEQLAEAPDAFLSQRRNLMNALEAAEAARRDAAASSLALAARQAELLREANAAILASPDPAAAAHAAVAAMMGLESEATMTVYRADGDDAVVALAGDAITGGPRSIRRDHCRALTEGGVHVSGPGQAGPSCEHADQRDITVCAPVATPGAGSGMVVTRAPLAAYGEDAEAEGVAFLTAATEQLAASLTEAAVRADLARSARTDHLTGLANRLAFLQALEAALARPQRSGRPVGLILADIDDFKGVNDTFGHEAGDHLLRGVAARLQQAVRNGDVLARLSGDEFIVMMAPTDAKAVEAAARRIVEATEDITDPDGAPLSMSAGGVMLGMGAVSWHDAYAAVDAALYRAKAAGKGRFLMSPMVGTRTREASSG